LIQDDEIRCSVCLALFPDNRDLITHKKKEQCTLRKYQDWIETLRRYWLPGDKHAKEQNQPRRRSDSAENQSRDIKVCGNVLIKAEPLEEVSIPTPLQYACAHKVHFLVDFIYMFGYCRCWYVQKGPENVLAFLKKKLMRELLMSRSNTANPKIVCCKFKTTSNFHFLFKKAAKNSCWNIVKRGIKIILYRFEKRVPVHRVSPK
jgi:hypothetical protein